MTDQTEGLHLYTIYSNPSDFPGKFVVRHFEGAEPRETVIVADTLHEARSALPPGLARIVRSPGDDPVILETWL